MTGHVLARQPIHIHQLHDGWCSRAQVRTFPHSATSTRTFWHRRFASEEAHRVHKPLVQLRCPHQARALGRGCAYGVGLALFCARVGRDSGTRTLRVPASAHASRVLVARAGQLGALRSLWGCSAGVSHSELTTKPPECTPECSLERPRSPGAAARTPRASACTAAVARACWAAYVLCMDICAPSPDAPSAPPARRCEPTRASSGPAAPVVPSALPCCPPPCVPLDPLTLGSLCPAPAPASLAVSAASSRPSAFLNAGDSRVVSSGTRSSAERGRSPAPADTQSCTPLTLSIQTGSELRRQLCCSCTGVPVSVVCLVSTNDTRRPTSASRV